MEICTQCLGDYGSHFNDYKRKKNCNVCKKNDFCIREGKVFKRFYQDITNDYVKLDDLSDFDRCSIEECGSEDYVTATFDIILSEYGIVDPVMDCFAEWIKSNNLKENIDGILVFNDGNLEGFNRYISEYNELVDSVLYHQRFINSKIKLFFEDFLSLTNIDGSSLKILDKSVDIYRARLLSKKDEFDKIRKNPEQELGAVPCFLAKNQRMTPVGISAFYGSLNRGCCINEVRPVVGGIVITGIFRPIRELRLIDFSKMEIINNSAEYNSKILQAQSFIAHLIEDISKPCIFGDSKEYISSQIFFEYLRDKYSEVADGVFYSSVQNRGKDFNVAIFPEKSGIKSNKLKTIDALEHLNYKEMLEFIPDTIRTHIVESVETKFSSYDEDNSYYVFSDKFFKKRLNELYKKNS